MRSALGASPRSIVKLYLGEGLVLAIAGAALGVVLAYGALQALLQLAPTSIPRASEISIDLASLGVAAAIAVLTGLFFSAIPFIRAGKAELTPMLRDGTRGSTSGRERQRVRSAFVVVQVALALVLLVGLRSARAVVPAHARGRPGLQVGQRTDAATLAPRRDVSYARRDLALLLSGDDAPRDRTWRPGGRCRIEAPTARSGQQQQRGVDRGSSGHEHRAPDDPPDGEHHAGLLQGNEHPDRRRPDVSRQRERPRPARDDRCPLVRAPFLA